VRHVTASATVRAPAGFAISFLNTYLQERQADTTTSQIRLEVPLTAFADSFAVQKTVDIQAHLEKAPDGRSDVLAISWQPHGGGPFPSFVGTVRGTSIAEPDSTLTIEGDYLAPGKIAGIIFDVTVGMGIARATLRRLLETFRDSIEADYRERSK
jgi:hypothetical protein